MKHKNRNHTWVPEKKTPESNPIRTIVMNIRVQMKTDITPGELAEKAMKALSDAGIDTYALSSEVAA